MKCIVRPYVSVYGRHSTVPGTAAPVNCPSTAVYLTGRPRTPKLFGYRLQLSRCGIHRSSSTMKRLLGRFRSFLKACRQPELVTFKLVSRFGKKRLLSLKLGARMLACLSNAYVSAFLRVRVASERRSTRSGSSVGFI